MIRLSSRVRTRSLCRPVVRCGVTFVRSESNSRTDKPQKSSDPRLAELGRAIEDDYATLRETYRKIQLYPCVLETCSSFR